MSNTHTPHTSRDTGRLSTTEAACAILAVALLAAACTFPLHSKVPDTATATVLIQPGDTLWSVASDHPVPGVDTARLVARIQTMNGLESSRLVAGDTIVVPVETSRDDYAMR